MVIIVMDMVIIINDLAYHRSRYGISSCRIWRVIVFDMVIIQCSMVIIQCSMVIILKVVVVILTAVVVIIKNMACHGISGWRIFINVKVVIINVTVIIVREAVIIVREAVIIVKDLVIILIDMAHQCARYGMSSCML